MRIPSAALALAALLLAACQAGSTPTVPPGTPLPEVTTPEEAALVVLERDARFAGIARRDPDLIGQGSWWDAAAAASGYEVTVEIGWGDCPAGCIHRHTWVFAVGSDGTITLVSEEGDALPGGGQGTVEGLVVAAPVCPVEQVPPDPACAPRPVTGATFVISDAAGRTVATVVTDAEGAFSVTLAPGEYRLVAQPVDGLMGTPEPLWFTAELGAPVELTMEYDTGIR